MARGVKLSEELRAAIQADLLSGESVTKVSEKYGVHEATVRGWKKTLPAAQLTAVHDKKEAEIADRVHRYLCANLDALIAQAALAADVTYLRRSPLSQFAILHGVMADKAARVLEVITGTAGREGTEDAGSEEAGPTPGKSIAVRYFDDNSTTAASLPEGD